MRFRNLVLLAILSFGSLAFGQDLSKPINYTTKAVRMEVAIGDISKAAGVKLFVQDELAKEPIILRLKGVPLQESMTKIADAIGAEWVKKPDGYDLIRSAAMEDKLREEEIDSAAKQFQNAIAKETGAGKLDQPLTDDAVDKMAKHIGELRENWDDPHRDWRPIHTFLEGLPDGRALWKLVAVLDTKKIGAMEDGTRLVFSNKPTKMEQAVDADLSDIAKSLFEDHNRLAGACTRLLKPWDPAKPIPSDYQYQTLSSHPDRFVLSVSREVLGQSFGFEIIAFDSQNHPILTYQTNINLDFGDNLQSQRARLVKQVQNEPDIQVSPETKQLFDLMRQMNGGNGSFHLTGSLRDALVHPEAHDPLALAASDAFLGTAEIRNENLVCYPDDTLFLVAMFSGEDGVFKPSLVLQTVQGLGDFAPTQVDEKDGWLVVRPIARLGSLRNRMDRVALGEYLRGYEMNGYFSIATMSKLAHSVHGNQMPILGIFLPLLTAPEQGSDSVQQGDISIWKFYGALTSDQAQTLAEKGQLHAGDLSSDQLDVLTHYFYENRQAGENSSGRSSQFTTQAEYAATRLPAEALPDGIPSDTVIEERDEVKDIYFANVTTNASTHTDVMNIDTMAYIIMMKDRPEVSDWNPKINSISPGHKRTITIGMMSTVGYGTQGMMSEETKIPGGPWTLDNLPPDVKSALDKAIQMRRSVEERRKQVDPPAKTTKSPL